MKRLVYSEFTSDNEYHNADIDLIVEACEMQGYYISRPDAVRVWNDYSDMMCAGWINVPADYDEIFRIVKYRTEEMEF
jgi:thiamine pyrophosphate-dependent acetolactate synthase large subunit-like protein